MTRPRAFAAVLIAALTLVACDPGEPTPAPAAEPEAPAETTAPAPDPEPVPEPEPVDTPDVEDAYIDLLESEYPELTADMSAAELVQIGYDTCTTIDAYGPLAAILVAVDSARGDPYAERMLGYVVGASVAAFCPEHLDDLEALA